jgi:adenylate cyclase
VQARAEPLYRRLGPRRYYNAYIVFDTLAGSLIWPITIAGLVALFFDFSFSEFLLVFALALAAAASAVGGGSLAARRTGEPVFAWAEAGRPPQGATVAWEAAVRLQRTQVRYTTALAFLLGVLPIVPVIAVLADLRPYQAAIGIALGAAAMAYAHVTHFFAIEPALRPIFRDISQRLPEPPASQTRVSLRWRMLVALLLINLQAAVAVGLLVEATGAPLGDAGLATVVAVLGYFAISLALTLLVASAILNPVRDLLGAMEEITAGDMRTRVAVTTGDELGTLTGRFNEMMDGLGEREALREAFGSYVAPAAAGRLLEEGGVLKGQEVEVTILFLDIRGFTSYAERREASEVVGFLNEFFGVVVPVVIAHGGYANRIIGDGLLAVFGAPEPLAGHAEKALAAAVEIAARVEEGYQGSVRIGIGLNSGVVVAGTITGGPKREYTVTGDAVNVASRVEGLTKETGDVILFTAATRELAGDPAREAQERGAIEVRGKSEPVRVFGLGAPPPAWGDASRSTNATP